VSSATKPFIDFKDKSSAAELGRGILKGLFDWAGKYQRTRGGGNSQTPLSDMGEFPLRDGPERPFAMDHAQPGAPCGGVRAGAMGNDGASVRERHRNQGEMKLCDAGEIRLSAKTR